jgi:hypothetical protein
MTALYKTRGLERNRRKTKHCGGHRNEKEELDCKNKTEVKMSSVERKVGIEYSKRERREK